MLCVSPKEPQRQRQLPAHNHEDREARRIERVGMWKTLLRDDSRFERAISQQRRGVSRDPLRRFP